MIKPRKDDSPMVAHARRELMMADLFTEKPEVQYDGELARATIALIKLYDKWTNDDLPKMQAVSSLFNSLIAGELISPPTTDPEEWEVIEKGDHVVWRNKRSPYYFSSDAGLRWTNMSTEEIGYSKDHITGEVKDAPVQPSKDPGTQRPDSKKAQGNTPANSGQSSKAGRKQHPDVAEQSKSDQEKPEDRKAKTKKREV